MARQTDEPQMTPYEQLMARMLEVQQQQAEAMAKAEARNRPKENPNYVADSIFLKPDGEPHAKDLKCDMYLNSIYLNKTPLTREEVDALNRLEPADQLRVMKVDGSPAIGSVEPKLDALGRLDRLTIRLPMKKDDNPQHYPRLVDLAKQLAPQPVVA